MRHPLRCKECDHLWGPYEDNCHCQFGKCHNQSACSSTKKLVTAGAKCTRHDRSCPAYGNYQPPYEECDCGYEDEARERLESMCHDSREERARWAHLNGVGWKLNG